MAWKPEGHQRGVTETGKRVEDGESLLLLCSQQQLCRPCWADSTEGPRKSREMDLPSSSVPARLELEERVQDVLVAAQENLNFSSCPNMGVGTF